jgi:hypothetical protein
MVPVLSNTVKLPAAGQGHLDAPLPKDAFALDSGCSLDLGRSWSSEGRRRMSTEDNKAVIRRYYDIAGDLELQDGMIADDRIDHEAPPDMQKGPAGHRQYLGQPTPRSRISRSPSSRSWRKGTWSRHTGHPADRQGGDDDGHVHRPYCGRQDRGVLGQLSPDGVVSADRRNPRPVGSRNHVNART